MKLLEPQSLIIILVIILVIFGPKRLPELGKSLGKTMKALRDGAEGKSADTEDADAAAKKDAEAPEKTKAE